MNHNNLRFSFLLTQRKYCSFLYFICSVISWFLFTSICLVHGKMLGTEHRYYQCFYMPPSYLLLTLTLWISDFQNVLSVTALLSCCKRSISYSNIFFSTASNKTNNRYRYQQQKNQKKTAICVTKIKCHAIL